MFVTVHSAIGIAVISVVGITNPFVAFLLGLILHFVADAVPHGDEELGVKAMQSNNPAFLMGALFAIDLLALGGLLIVLAFNNIFSLAILFVVFGSVIPDIVLGIELVLKPRHFSPLTRLHCLAHKATGIIFSFKIGLPFQLIVTLFMVATVFFTYK